MHLKLCFFDNNKHTYPIKIKLLIDTKLFLNQSGLMIMDFGYWGDTKKRTSTITFFLNFALRKLINLNTLP